ncbi:MAG: endonuclease MutS2 [Anaerolineaceae bacterium]|nr:endonuclease MutS2 [Anaerolineaceae bacterium]
MDEKTLHILEFPVVLERLAAYADFSASAELARALHPSRLMEEVLLRQARTAEARRLLSLDSTISVGGARDIRAKVELAAHAGVLEEAELLDIRNTLIAARELGRTLERHAAVAPNLALPGASLPPPAGVIEAISRAISDRGEVVDGASDRLASIRRELKAAHDRLLGRLERIINDPKNIPMLQDTLITQRNGRYVVPLRAEFKGQLRSIIHDQSSSGATLFVEPLVVVELNNQQRELQLAERDEVRRILAELSAQVGGHAAALIAMLGALAQIDLALMCARYADDLHASEPVIVPSRPRAGHPGSVIQLMHARHPLLPPEKVVPVDIMLDESTFAVVITGPNTGGKTVTLKTVGLLAVMAQSGLHIPAQSGSTLSLFENVFADIGDEQSIEQSLSTFSGHITNIVRILKRAVPRTLVLLDELGAGTDPQEGAALARALLADLVARTIPCLAATHYPELKAFAHATPGVVNASMEFDLQTLRPTYRLTIGLPGRSNALLIAERLGLRQEIIRNARATIDPADLRAEDLLDEIHRQREQAREARAETVRSLQAAEEARGELEQRLENIEDERLKVLESTRAQAQEELEALRRELESTRRELQRARQPLEALKPVQESVEALEAEVEKPVVRRVRPQSKRAPLRVGSRVHLPALHAEGVVTAIGENDLEVQIGALRLRARPNDIQVAGEEQTPAPPPKPAPRPRTGKKEAPAAIFHASPGVELDLRGQRAEDALPALERFLEQAYLAGLPYVRIIHGKGTGRLRQAARETLRQLPQAARFENGLDSEGGEGVTVVHLKGD